MPTPPASYVLAEKHRLGLRRRYRNFARTLSDDGAKTRLRTFRALLEAGCPAVNMNLSGCIRFLETGRPT